MPKFLLPFAEPLFWVTTWILLSTLVCNVIDGVIETWRNR